MASPPRRRGPCKWVLQRREVQFRKSSGRNERLRWCRCCAAGMTAGCTHCSKQGTHIAVHLPNGRHYSHLVGSPMKLPGGNFDSARFKEMLTDYDRILLQFGMGVSW